MEEVHSLIKNMTQKKDFAEPEDWLTWHISSAAAPNSLMMSLTIKLQSLSGGAAAAQQVGNTE